MDLVILTFMLCSVFHSRTLTIHLIFLLLVSFVSRSHLWLIPNARPDSRSHAKADGYGGGCLTIPWNCVPAEVWERENISLVSLTVMIVSISSHSLTGQGMKLRLFNLFVCPCLLYSAVALFCHCLRYRRCCFLQRLRRCCSAAVSRSTNQYPASANPP